MKIDLAANDLEAFLFILSQDRTPLFRDIHDRSATDADEMMMAPDDRVIAFFGRVADNLDNLSPVPQGFQCLVHCCQRERGELAAERFMDLFG